MATDPRLTSALAAGLQTCLDCGWVHPQGSPRCPRCGAPVHPRKPRSIQRAWAFWLTALALYLPANGFPIMITEMLGKAKPSTIIGGVWVLIEHHAYLVAAVVFVASVMIPILKFIAVGYLLWSVQWGRRHDPAERLRLYRWVEAVGRWSMIDVFVVAILAALIQFGGLARVYPGPGADAFAAVVVFTMLAANALDPRLIWDGPDEAGDADSLGASHHTKDTSKG